MVPYFVIWNKSTFYVLVADYLPVFVKSVRLYLSTCNTNFVILVAEMKWLLKHPNILVWN